MNAGISHETRKARKQHQCDWCGEAIASGETYAETVGVADGEFCRGRMHLECDVACQQAWRDKIVDDVDYWRPGAFERGCYCERGQCQCRKGGA